MVPVRTIGTIVMCHEEKEEIFHKLRNESVFYKCKFSNITEEARFLCRASFFYPKEDPAYATCPVLQSLGESWCRSGPILSLKGTVS